jgi:hypothetical protein
MQLGIFVMVVIVVLVADVGRAAILDPMTAMKDDISRIKVMMETVGGNFNPHLIIITSQLFLK